MVKTVKIAVNHHIEGMLMVVIIFYALPYIMQHTRRLNKAQIRIRQLMQLAELLEHGYRYLSHPLGMLLIFIILPRKIFQAEIQDIGSRLNRQLRIYMLKNNTVPHARAAYIYIAAVNAPYQRGHCRQSGQENIRAFI